MEKRNPSICWNLTSRCNLNCKFCYANKLVEEGSLEKQKEVVLELIDQNFKEVTFSGGEPLLVNHLIELLKFAKAKGLKVNLSTNGILLNQHNLHEIIKNISTLSIPLDSLKNEVLTSMRGNSSFFEKIKEISKLSGGNVSLNVFTLVTPENKDELLDIFNELNKIEGVKYWKLSNYYPVENVFDEFVLTDKEYEHAVEKVKNLKSRFKIIVRYKDERYQENYLLLDPVGNIYTTTCNKHNIVGNIFKKPFEEVQFKIKKSL